ncbi:hypothetical protein B566_EDAN013093 [Ephemera danica]|nr:hypothetical protein B566_EDAN013093 [Ephemera danica]
MTSEEHTSCIPSNHSVMKFQLLFIFCVAAVSPTVAIQDIIIDELKTIIPNATRVFEVIEIGIKAVKGVAGQELVCYQCTNSDENEHCAQGNAAQQLGEKMVTRHSCAMVNENDALDDQALCTSSLYMVGGVSGEVEKCELCATDRCNEHKPPTARAQLFYEPYVQASNLVQTMELGHVQHEVQSMRYKSNASPPLMVSIGLLIANVLLSCIH